MEHKKILKRDMLEHAAHQQRSGKSVASYAKQIGVFRSKMQYWVSKYKSGQKAQTTENATSLKFIDLGSFGTQNQPTDEDSPAKSLETTAASPACHEPLPQMTLTFPNGICLKIY